MEKILAYTENYLPGGGNRYFIDMINSIPEDYEVTVISNNGGLYENDFKSINRNYNYKSINIITIQIINNIIFNKNIKILLLAYRIFRKLFRFIMIIIQSYYNRKILKEAIKQEMPNLVLCCNGGYPAALTCLDMIKVCDLLKIRSILTIVSMPASRKIYEKIRYNFKKSKVSIIVNSNRIKEDLVAKRNFNPDAITILYNCIQPFNIKIENKRSNDKEYLNKDIKIGYIGRLEERKGTFILLRAFSKVIKIFPNAKLLLVGYSSDKDMSRIYNINKRYNINKNVIIYGYYDGNIFEMLDVIDIFVFPSLWEGFPYAIIEAMWAGKIIISSDVGGIPEAIDNGINGFLIPPCNEKALTDKINEIIKNYTLYKHIGINAQKKVEDYFTFIKFRKSFERHLQMIFSEE